MPSRLNIARDITYARSATSRAGQTLIRLMENATGRLALIKRADGYEDDVAQGHDFWEVMVKRYGLTLDIAGGTLGNIPKTGPVIVVSNHPYGILDGLVMGHILSTWRGDFKIVANSVFTKARELDRKLLPISFETDRKAMALNIETRKTALSYLGAGGAVGIFPGGTVSTGAKLLSHPMDPRWRGFTARMIAKSQATVVPMFFDGHTSRMFQIASHMHSTLRVGLLINEFKKRVDTPVRVVIGTPLQRDVLNPLAGDTKAMMDFLRKATYELSPTPLSSYDYGYEFEQQHRA